MQIETFRQFGEVQFGVMSNRANDCINGWDEEFNALALIPMDAPREAGLLWAQAERRANYESIYS